MPPPTSANVHIITTGGTIDKMYFDALSEYRVGAPQIAEVLREAGVTLGYRVETLFRKDSLEITDEDRAAICASASASPEGRVLITHGTDTMAETARALETAAETDERLAAKTIALVGSLAPARFKQSDAVFNIGFALGALAAASPGVYVAMNGRLFAASAVQKNRELGRFEVR